MRERDTEGREADYQVPHSARGINADHSTMLYIPPLSQHVHAILQRAETDRQRGIEKSAVERVTRDREKLRSWSGGVMATTMAAVAVAVYK